MNSQAHSRVIFRRGISWIVLASYVLLCGAQSVSEYRGGANYCRVEVSVSKDAGETLGAFTVSRFSRGKMLPPSAVEQCFRQPWAAPVEYIDVASTATADASCFTVMIRGRGFFFPDRQIQVISVQEIAGGGLRVQQNARVHRLKCAPVGASLLPGPSRCFNWNGDWMLVGRVALANFAIFVVLMMALHLLLMVAALLRGGREHIPRPAA